MPEPIDLLLLADTVLTPEVLAGAEPEPGYVAVSGNRIVSVGPAADSASWRERAARVIDLGPSVISSGFIDAHIHPILGLEFSRGIELTEFRDRESVSSAVAAYCRDTSSEWVLGWGLDPSALDNRLDNSFLDDAAQARKVCLTLSDDHAVIVSDAALEAAGITGHETFPDASVVGTDSAGVPNGALIENSAADLVRALVPPLTFDQRVDALEDLLTGMAASGLVAGQMLDLAVADSFDLLDALEARTELPIRLRVSPWLDAGSDDRRMEELAEMQGRHGRRWKVRGIKMMIDGTIDNGTAWLQEPDTRGESTSSLWLDPDRYRRAVEYYDFKGIPTTTHAIGDRAVDFVAGVISGLPEGGPQHRIEHLETLPDDILQRVVDSGAAVSMQPTHCTLYTYADHHDNWSQRLGAERADHAWRTADLRGRGVIVTLGSDWNVAPYDPRAILASAVLRRPAGHPEIAPIHPEQGLSRRESVEGYTSQYWASVGETGGEIVAGGRADLSVFGANPLTCHPDEFAEAAVILTVVDGVISTDNLAALPDRASSTR
ncbi:MAG: amidohydrolase family protein [Acidipropionibacterium sp.]|jgi:predicted amidohydrolase YtcJ|nr:amidohydrolase family protein [Acidipropionibacterium sp.]